MNDDRRALLNNIIANPGDDLPRLVYADWLEEREDMAECPACEGKGQWRVSDAAGDMDDEPCRGCYATGEVSNGFKCQADFIRAQCGHISNKRESSRLEREWEDLIQGKWAPLEIRLHPRDDFGDADLCVWFQRGFIDQVYCTMAQWEKYGPEICREHPVEWVEIADRHPEPPNGDARWVWWIGLADGVVDLPYMLPKRLNEGREAHLQFKTGGEARDWFSRRCIAWARSVNS